MNSSSCFVLIRIAAGARRAPAAVARMLGRFVALSLCLALVPLHAQTASDPDPPDRVARLSLVQGEVSMQPAGQQEWTSAILNRPLTTGDKLWTNPGARAEIYVGPAAVRLDSGTGFSFLNVDDDTIQMRMTAGVLEMRVRSLAESDHIEIDTPNLAVSVLRPGNYRVEVNEAGDVTTVKVSAGEAEGIGGSQDVVVHAQQAATFRGTQQLAADFGTLGAPDEFDSWSLERDRRDEQAEAAQSNYVPPEMTGYEDLATNGTWASDPEYGYVWTPTVVAVDWAPYRFGRWVWIAPWGWTWVDDEPWGFAPFHYGRWVHARDRWCWVPGPRHVRPVYAPALVAWVGTPGVGVSVSIGADVAWFPLGPREVYVPARRFSPRYVERVNVTNTVIVNKTYITNVYEHRVTDIAYRNRAVPGAVTAVSRTTFTSAEPVGRHRVRIDDREIERMHAMAAPPRIEPGRQSVLGVSEAARRNVRTPPAALVDREVVVKRAPPPSAARFVRTPEKVAGAREQANARVEPGPRDDRERATHEGAREAQQARRERGAQPDEAQARREERPPQSQLRTDRPPGANRPVIPDSIHRTPERAVQSEPPVRREPLQRAPQTERPDRPPQAAPRAEPQRMQIPRGENPQEPAPRPDRPRVESPRVERPQMERQSRPEPPRQAEQSRPRELPQSRPQPAPQSHPHEQSRPQQQEQRHEHRQPQQSTQQQ